MTRQHFEAFAAESAKWRNIAKMHEQAGKTDEAEQAHCMALGIENATIEVAKQFNHNFDETRFRRACNPTSIKNVLDDILDARERANQKLSGKR